MRRPAIRVWFPVALLLGYWGYMLYQMRAEQLMFVRFSTRMLALLVLFLGFHLWWLTRRRIPLKERLLLEAICFGVWFLAGFLTHRTMDHVALVMYGVPSGITLWTLWQRLTDRWSLRTRRLSFAALMVLNFGALSLLRWEGLDGRQQAELHWRWTPSAEERFLDDLENSGERHARAATDAWELQAGDWPEFQGPRRDGVAPATARQDWSTTPPKLLWKRRVGPAWSSMIVVGSFLVTQEQRGENEAIVCYSARNGDEIWALESPGRFFEAVSSPGPRATPTFADGRIFAYGGLGRLSCLESTSGQELWHHDVPAETGGAVPMWGVSCSPLVVGGKVLVFAGGKNDQGLVAYDVESGELAWSCPTSDVSYSSPQLATLSGVK